MTQKEKLELVPVWLNTTLTLDEATAYSGLGRDKLIELSMKDELGLVLWVGRKRLFKRQKLDDYINREYSGVSHISFTF